VLDKLRFRANVYMDLEEEAGFAENTLVGETLPVLGVHLRAANGLWVPKIGAC
jgi:hypothetical protein